MGWLKVDDKMPRNPKILAGDIETAWFYVCALTHAAEQLTDGFIARSAVPLIAPHITDPHSVADRCVDLDLFRQVEGGYEVRDFLDYNPSRASVLDRRTKDAERQASRRESQRDTAQTSGVSPRVPSRPVPSPRSSSSTTTTTPAAVDNSPRAEEIEEIAAAVIDARCAKQTNIRSPDAWKRTALGNLRNSDDWPRLIRLAAEYPGAPTSLIVAAIEGEPTQNLNHYRQRDPA